MTPAENYKNWGENLLARFFSPAERVQQGIQNPGAALGAFLAGSTTYATKPPSEKKLEQKVRSLLAEPNHDTIVNLNAAVAAAEKNGDEAGAERAQEIIRKIRATQEALFNAWLRRRQGLKPLPTASPAPPPAAGGNIFDPATSGGNPFAPSP
jgi:small-conductance mechanosensitive channel